MTEKEIEVILSNVKKWYTNPASKMIDRVRLELKHKSTHLLTPFLHARLEKK
jgi:hypothetical protein